MKPLLLILALLGAQEIRFISKPDGDFSCRIVKVTKAKKIELRCTDGTRLLIPRAEWRHAWGELPEVWGEKQLVGQIYYAQRRDGRMTAVEHESKLQPCSMDECEPGDAEHPKCRCELN